MRLQKYSLYETVVNKQINLLSEQLTSQLRIKFQNIHLSVIERTDCENEHYFGKGFYNDVIAEEEKIMCTKQSCIKSYSLMLLQRVI